MNNVMNGISDLLELLAQELDIPEKALEDATSRYVSMGAWLNRPASSLAAYRPAVYPQGSINLGTVIKPYDDEDHYDVDLVCEVLESKANISQAKLKELVGREVKAYAKANNMNNPAQEGRRCWTLDYAAGARFHMDILPCLPDGQGFQRILEQQKFRMDNLHRHAISITDNTRENYQAITNDWPQSNPKGYSDWFKQRMLTQLNERRRQFAESTGRSILEIPEFAVKTTLQRAIQLLKRHRDIMFAGAPEHKPISIIITTLAAQAYNNEPDLAQALINIIQHLPKFIEYRDEGIWIPNPVNPLENFADRWDDEPQRNQSFFDWLSAAKEAFASTTEAKDIRVLNESLSASFGDLAVGRAMAKLPSGTRIHQVAYPIAQIDQSETRFQVKHSEVPPWAMDLRGEVSIRGKFGHRNSWYDFTPDSKPVPKNRKLKFKAKTTISGPFDVYWQVVNTGEEARNAGGLRGSIFAAKGFGPDAVIHNESTSYRGMHWVRCFVVTNGKCVAQSAPFVVNIA